ncbi:MAG: efflux RND transporter permease subunit [Succinivibrionaceae bacterium]|nr:efflux RND transporter permease subunit [Succinivibrionaceae bacterium]
MSTFFVNRPIFATVLALLTCLFGVLGLRTMALEQLPDIAPPTIQVSARYNGASAETVENTVTQLIEQQLSGLDGLLYFTSTSSANGNSSISVVFDQGTNPDIAQMQVNNNVEQISSRLPEDVVTSGIKVSKRDVDSFLTITVYDELDRHSGSEVGDFLISNLQDPLSRIEGVGSVDAWCSQHAMRVWLNPELLRSYSLMPSDVITAIKRENVQLSAGQVGALPSAPDQALTMVVTAASMLSTVDDFRHIIVKHEDSDGSFVTLGDVAEIELGSESYNTTTRFDGHPAASLVLYLSSGANTLETTSRVLGEMEMLKDRLPEGFRVAYPSESKTFIERSLEEVLETLFIAMLLVVAVTYLFLGNAAATLIPTLTMPVVILGTAGVLSSLGFTINTLTMFALVIAIGLLVDDTIVVVENVERTMRERGLNAKEATIVSMREVFSSLVGISVVLSVVFLPMACFGGASGIIYRQFSVTIIASMVLSVLTALTLVPALCALLLRQGSRQGSAFTRWFGRLTRAYRRGIIHCGRWAIAAMVAYVAIAIVDTLLYSGLRTAFIPDEDQGRISVAVTMPEASTIDRAYRACDQVIEYFRSEEGDNIAHINNNIGRNLSGQGQNYAMVMVTLRDWDERPGPGRSAAAILERAQSRLPGLVRDASINAFVASPVRGMGDSSGFEIQIQAGSGVDRKTLDQQQEQFLEELQGNPILRNVRAARSSKDPQLHIDFDNIKAAALGVSISDAYATLSSAFAGKYVNNFLDQGRVKRVYVQSLAQFRRSADDLRFWTVRNSDGDMVPLSTLTSSGIARKTSSLARYNGFAAYRISGRPALGHSTGEAMQIAARVAREHGIPYSWSGISYQESRNSGSALYLYSLSALVIFLCLAALYESWSIPICILAVIPFGVLGAVGATMLRNLDGNVYFQVALLTTIGLGAKNAIMMITFMRDNLRSGMDIAAAAISAATIRLRPIIMTSLAFVAGVFPLALASGVGANSRIAIGTGIVGGTLLSTLLSIFFVPLFFIGVERMMRRWHRHPRRAASQGAVTLPRHGD